MPSRSAALGGYSYTATAEDHIKTKTTGKICDDVVGEVPDKVVRITGTLHLGGTETDKAVENGDLPVPKSFCFIAYDVLHDPSPLGSKIVATNSTYNLV